MNMAKRKAEESTISDLLKDFIGNGKLEKGLNQVDIKDAWSKVLGPGIQKYTTKVILERDVLYVQLSSSVLREELGYGKEKIIRLLNEEVGKNLVDKLVLR
ncbi:MAG: hypothetical protein ACJA1Z_000763 [Patiriisocius sp.]|jgi:hypothetical protein